MSLLRRSDKVDGNGVAIRKRAADQRGNFSTRSGRLAELAIGLHLIQDEPGDVPRAFQFVELIIVTSMPDAGWRPAKQDSDPRLIDKPAILNRVFHWRDVVDPFGRYWQQGKTGDLRLQGPSTAAA
jgi:hypothetical protein